MSALMQGLGASGIRADYFGNRIMDNARAENAHEKWKFGADMALERHGMLKEDRALEAKQRDFAEVSGIAADLFAVKQEDGSVRKATMEDIFADPNKARDLERVMKSKYARETFFQGNEFVRVQDMGDGTSTIVLRNKEGKEVALTRDGVQDPKDPNYETDPVRVFKPEDMGGLLSSIEHDLTRTGRNFENAESEILGVGGEQPQQRSATESYFRTGQLPELEQPTEAGPTLGGAAPAAGSTSASALAEAEIVPDPTPVVSRVTAQLGLTGADPGMGGNGRGQTQLASTLGAPPMAPAELEPEVPMVQVGTLPDGTPHMKPANAGPDKADRLLGAASSLVGRTAAIPLKVGADVVGGKSPGEAVGNRARDVVDAGAEVVAAGSDIAAAGVDLAKRTGEDLIAGATKFAADVRTGFGKLPQSQAANKVPDTPIGEVKPEAVPELTFEAFSEAAKVGETLNDAEARADTPEGKATITAERTRIGNTAVNMVLPGSGGINTRRAIKGYAMMVNAGLMTPVQADAALGRRIAESQMVQIAGIKAQSSMAKDSAANALTQQRLTNAWLDQQGKLLNLEKGAVELSKAQREQRASVAEAGAKAIHQGLMANGLYMKDEGKMNIGGQLWDMEKVVGVVYEGLYQQGGATGLDLAEIEARGSWTQAERATLTALATKKFADLAQNRPADDSFFTGGPARNKTLDPVVADGQEFEVHSSSGPVKVPITELIADARERYAGEPGMAEMPDEEVAARIMRNPAAFGIIR